MTMVDGQGTMALRGMRGMAWNRIHAFDAKPVSVRALNEIAYSNTRIPRNAEKAGNHVDINRLLASIESAKMGCLRLSRYHYHGLNCDTPGRCASTRFASQRGSQIRPAALAATWPARIVSRDPGASYGLDINPPASVSSPFTELTQSTPKAAFRRSRLPPAMPSFVGIATCAWEIWAFTRDFPPRRSASRAEPVRKEAGNIDEGREPSARSARADPAVNTTPLDSKDRFCLGKAGGSSTVWPSSSQIPKKIAHLGASVNL
jgi:hypothetical protein